MKELHLPVIYSLLLAGSWIFLSGCGTTSNIQSKEANVAQILGIEQSEIRLLTYCYYAEIWDLETKSVDFTHCVLALNGTQLHLLDDDLKVASTSETVVVPIAEINGVGVRNLGATRQVQLLFDGHILAITFILDMLFRGKEVPQDLHDLLVTDGVSQWQCERLFNMANSPYEKVPLMIPLPL